jgi:alpha-beta hydrolase superfamily lysophospholipase
MISNRKTALVIGLVLLIFHFYSNRLYAQTIRHKVSKRDSLKIANEAFKMIYKPEPVFKPFQLPKMDSVQIADLGFDQVYKSDPVKYRMRDGKYLSAQKFRKPSNTTILLLHGILSSSFTMNRMAGMLRAATKAQIISIDIRGHGGSEGNPGDVDYIDQYADDLADLITTVKKQNPGGRIIIAAHSMGGGIALRYAMKKSVPSVDGYLLFAPLLGQNAPTLPKDSADTGEVENFMKIYLLRIIGLRMYNSIGVHQYDNLPVLFFNLPKEMPLNKYTYRSNISMAPDDYKAGIRAVSHPLLVIVGSKDEAFVASQFKAAVENNGKGHVILINGATHDGVRHNTTAMDSVKAWYIQNNFDK